MDEQEKLNMLTQELNGGAQENEPKNEQTESEQVLQQEPQAQEPQPQPQQLQPQPPQAQDETLSQIKKELGIGALEEKLQALEQERALREEFDNNVARFKTEYPNVALEEVVKFAKENKVDDLLGSFNGWTTIAKTMFLQASLNLKPDPITATNANATTSPQLNNKKDDNVGLGNELLSLI